MTIASNSAVYQVPRRSRVGTWWTSPALLYLPALLILVPVFVIPTLLILSMSFTAEPGGVAHYQDAFGSDLVRNVLLRSFGLAAVVTLIALVVGLPFSAVALRATPRFRNFLYGSIAASLFFSVVVRAYAWLALLGRGGPVHSLLQAFGMDTADLKLINSPTGIIIGMVQYGIPFMVLAISDVMRRIDDNYERAAATLGAGPIVRWFRVKLPMLMPGIVAGTTIVFVTTLGYFIIPSILGSPQDMMIGQLISNQVGTTLNWGYGAALASILLLITLVLVLVLQKVGRMLGRH